VFLIGVQPVLPDLTEFRHFSLKTTGDRHATGEQQISRLDNNIAKKHSLTSKNTRGDHPPPASEWHRRLKLSIVVSIHIQTSRENFRKTQALSNLMLRCCARVDVRGD